MTFIINNWDDNYENNRTRSLQKLSWVPFPNSHDGDGYTELVDHKNGASHLGAFVVMVQVASKCHPRGTLVRSNEKPHDSASLSRMTKLPKSVFDETIPRLLLIGWIDEVEPKTGVKVESGTIPHLGAVEPHPSVSERKKERREGKERMEAEMKSLFDIARTIYPGKKSGVDPEYDNFKKKFGSEIIELLGPAIQNQIDWRLKAEKAGKWVADWKQFSTWINQQCWTDEMPIIPTESKPKTKEDYEAIKAKARAENELKRVLEQGKRNKQLAAEKAEEDKTESTLSLTEQVKIAAAMRG